MILSTYFFGLVIDPTLRQLIGDLGVDMTITYLGSLNYDIPPYKIDMVIYLTILDSEGFRTTF